MGDKADITYAKLRKDANGRYGWLIVPGTSERLPLHAVAVFRDVVAYHRAVEKGDNRAVLMERVRIMGRIADTLQEGEGVSASLAAKWASDMCCDSTPDSAQAALEWAATLTSLPY